MTASLGGDFGGGIMRASLLTVLALTLLTTAFASGEEIIPITWKGKKEDAFKGSPARLTEAQAIAIARLSVNLDLDAKIDVVETTFEDVLKDIGEKREISIAVDAHGLKEASVTPSQLVTLKTEKLPPRKCLHRLLDPLELTFVICPDGLLVTSPVKKP